MELSIKELLEATNGTLLKGGELSAKVSVSTDTRTITGTDFFMPIKGTNFDGHDYIEEALNKDCRGYFTSNNSKIVASSEFVIGVEDTLIAYLQIANYVRKKINPVVIAVTGSSGKTTTKEFIYSVLSTSFRTHKSELNYNNEIGLCKTVLAMPENTEYAVIEMGMRASGEIELLSKYAEPDIAIITNVGTAHIGRLGSVDNIAKAKCEITSHLKQDGKFIAYNDELIKKYCKFNGDKLFYPGEYKIISQEENFTEFIYKNETYKIPASGKYNVINSAAAIEIGLIAGVSPENIRKGLLNYTPVGDRGKIITRPNNIKFILDCYNANPDSVKVSIESVIDTYKNFKIVLVLADMAELGEHEEALHKEIGAFISGKPIHSLITIGEKAKVIADSVENIPDKKSFINNQEAASHLKNNQKPGSVYLFKGSRCMKLEEVVDYLS